MWYVPSKSLTLRNRAQFVAHYGGMWPREIVAAALVKLDPPCFPVEIDPQPVAPEGHRVTRNAQPSEVEGAWRLGWTVEPIPKSEIDAAKQKARSSRFVTRRAFARACFYLGMVDVEAARAWAAGTALPLNVETLIKGAITDAREQGLALIDASGAETIRRNNPIILLLASPSGFNLSEDEIDQIFDTADRLG